MNKWFFLKLVELYLCWLVLVSGGALAFFKGVGNYVKYPCFVSLILGSCFGPYQFFVFVFASLLGGWTLDIFILHGFFFLCLFNFDWHAGLDAFYFSWYFFVFLSSSGMLSLSFFVYVASLYSSSLFSNFVGLLSSFLIFIFVSLLPCLIA